ncbi:hypothetical protein MYX82_10665 [Acidobacteria bacterium AH-259-D05]|nr:hypothetical protein [Acidobacteria bacterium AH-259-D05]
MNAATWRDGNGRITVDIKPKHNEPAAFECFRQAYKEATGSTKIRMKPLIDLNEPLIRWALVRESYLLVFYHWGYWLLRKSWAAEAQQLLNDLSTPLSAGCYVSIPKIEFQIRPTKGEFAVAKMPSGRRCWLVPVIDKSWVVMPTDDPSQTCSSLWEEVEQNVVSANAPQPFSEFKKVVVDRNVKTCTLWKVAERNDPDKNPDYWIEIVPGEKAQFSPHFSHLV